MSAHPTSSLTAGLAACRLWGGPRQGAELDGLSDRPEVPPHVP